MQDTTSGYQLSQQQRQVWQSYAEGCCPVAAITLLLEGEVDERRLQDALQALAARHEILRTSFRRPPGMKFPLQVVHGAPSITWKVIDFQEAPRTAASIDSLLEKLASEFSGNHEIEQTAGVYACLARWADRKGALIIAVSSLCADASSLTKLANQFFDIYAGSAPANEDVLQYADYSEWQSELIYSADPDAHALREYWKQQDILSIPSLSLPFQAKQQRKTAFSPERVPVEMAAEGAGQFAPENLTDLLLACWSVLLGRLSGQRDILVGIASANSGQEELERAIGPFEKVVPLLIKLDDKMPFATVIETIRSTRLRAVESADHLVAEISGLQLPVTFRVQAEPSVREAGGVSMCVHQSWCEPSRFRLELRCRFGVARVRPELFYDPGSFSRDVVEQFAARLSMLIHAAIAQPNQPIRMLPVMNEDERRRVTVGFNQTQQGFSSDKCIQQLFQDQVARTPSRPALRFENIELSYGILNQRANQLAHFLRKQGIGRNVPVGLLTERSAEMIVGVLGIMKAGACYLPLVFDNPKTRLAHQLSEAQCPALLTQEKLLDRVPEFSGKVICLDREWQEIAQEDTDNPRNVNTPDDLVYVIYTSGSTGAPKGVAVRHSSLVNYSEFICRKIQTTNHSEGLHFATVSTLSADLGNTCVFPSLISGGCLHVIAQETAMSADLFRAYVAEHPIDVLKITPSHMNALLNASDAQGLLPRRYLFLGGEVCSWESVNRVTQTGDCSIINHYGPTEATVGCCTFTVRENDVSAWSPATVPIGRPIANDEVYILDGALDPVPIGVAGELCIGGVGLAKGYLNQPQQTAERFVKNPLSNDASARLYRTGDLARFLPDGNIEFLGRIDHQVKIRGFRVEPAEIEAVLKQHPGVTQALVISYDDKMQDKRLAAYVVPRKPTAAGELRDFLVGHLPDYMVPSAIVLLDSLPLTANGKIDRKALPAPETDSRQPKRDFVSPRNSDEETILAIWTEVLKVDGIGVIDNFFDLGGHSLLATQIISRIRKQFRVQMPLHSFLETPTVAGLAEKISQCPAAETGDEEMARLLQELEGLSDEEAERLLAEEQSSYKERGQVG